MGTLLFANTVTCTFSNLASTLSSLTTDTSITIFDLANVVLNNSSVSGSLGNIIKSYTGSYLLDFSPSDFSTAKYTANAIGIFYNCTKLSGMCQLPSSMTDARSMFEGCTGLTSIDTTTFTNVTNAHSMFSGCTGLTSINTSGFTNITNSGSMFLGCTGLTSIDTTAFIKVTNTRQMFSSCTGLTSIDTAAFINV